MENLVNVTYVASSKWLRRYPCLLHTTEPLAGTTYNNFYSTLFASSMMVAMNGITPREASYSSSSKIRSASVSRVEPSANVLLGGYKACLNNFDGISPYRDSVRWKYITACVYLLTILPVAAKTGPMACRRSGIHAPSYGNGYRR